MNEILLNREYFIHSDNGNSYKKHLPHLKNYNALWGPEYLLMNEKNFIENNADGIIEIMVLNKTTPLAKNQN
jgi:hypothetical protein